jgi:hypothetical protein
MERNARGRQHQLRKAIERRARSVEAMEFFNVLASLAMVETVYADFTVSTSSNVYDSAVLAALEP